MASAKCQKDKVCTKKGRLSTDGPFFVIHKLVICNICVYSKSADNICNRRHQPEPIQDEKYTSIENLEKSLEESDIHAHFEKNKRLTKVHVSLPRFKIESEHDLNDVLKSMGMTDMLIHGKADFSGMLSNKRISVSQVTLL